MGSGHLIRFNLPAEPPRPPPVSWPGEPRFPRGRVSDPRPPDDGRSWPERDPEGNSADEPAAGWSDDPYRYERPQYHQRPYEPLGASEPPAYQAEPPPDEPEQDQPEPESEVDPQEPEPEPEPVAPIPPPLGATEPTTAFEGSAHAWDPKRQGNRRRPTTAEQAVPWLIGIILALAGMVIVLLALIFTSPDGLVAGQPTATPGASVSLQPASLAPASAEPSVAASPSEAASAPPDPTPGPTPTAQPSFGPLEMVYLGRPSGVAPIYLLRRDFSVADEPEIMAQADQGVTQFAWSPDGRVGAAVIAGRAVALTPGQSPRRLADNISALTFGWESDVVYGVRITRDGANDRAQILQIDFATRAADVLANVRYPRPLIGAEAPLREAQFIDDGGVVRLYAVADGNLTLWVLGAPSIYRIDPANGDVSEVSRQPTLWSPDGMQRITLHESGNSTTLRLRDRSSTVISATTVTGLVSHVRWAATSNEIAFTIGRLSGGGGVRQDMYVWNLQAREDPAPLTSSGVSFGAEWRGVMPNWAP